MAFMGIFMMGLAAFLIVVGVLFTAAVVFLIVSIVMQCRYKKKLSNVGEDSKKPGKWYLIPRILSILNFAPLVFMTVAFAVSMIQSAIESHNSLAGNVNKGNYERVRDLLEDGVSPDCTDESNEPAADGDRTLLMLLCENHGFFDSYEDPVDYELTSDELAMIELLIEYGADVNAERYRHERESDGHTFTTETDYYNIDDCCGYTPLMYAVRSGDAELVKLLIESGADVNHRDYCGFTPVAIVADELEDEEGAEILRMLIENGASVDTITNFGQTPLFLAFRNTVGGDPDDKDEIMDILDEAYENERID